MKNRRNLDIGIIEIDQQHRELVATLNRLVDQLHSGETSTSYRGTVDFLCRYAEEHFSLEESYMDRFEFPGKESHMEDHNLFREKVALLSNSCDAVDTNRKEFSDLADYITNWLIAHIARADKELGNYLERNGMTCREGAKVCQRGNLGILKEVV